MFGEIEVAPDEQFGLHPVVLDAALSTVGGDPVEWRDFRLFATGAAKLRVRLTPLGDDRVAVLFADRSGRPVAAAESVTLRQLVAPAAVASAPAVVKKRRAVADDVSELELTEKGLQAFVLEQVAGLLGYADTAELDEDAHFLEIGFDSLTAVELRNRIGSAAGVSLPASIAFDHRTPAGLAKHLLTVLTGPAVEAGGDPVTEMFFEAVRDGQVENGLALLGAAARLRSSFQTVAELREEPRPVELAAGPAELKLLAVPTPAGMGGAYQYAKLAARFRGCGGSPRCLHQGL